MPSDEQIPLPLLALEPTENVRVASGLDGRDGTNRATGNRPQTAANHDVDAIKA
jgi:hypothetical protein